MSTLSHYPPNSSKSQIIVSRETIEKGTFRRSLDGRDGPAGGYVTEPESAGRSIWRLGAWRRRVWERPTKVNDGAAKLSKKNRAETTMPSRNVADEATPDPSADIDGTDTTVARTGSLPEGFHGPGPGSVGQHGQYVQTPDGGVVHPAAADIQPTIQLVLESEPTMQMTGAGSCEQADEPRGSTPPPPVFQQSEPPTQVILVNNGMPPEFQQDTLKSFAIQMDEAMARGAVTTTNVVTVTDVDMSVEPLQTPGQVAHGRGSTQPVSTTLTYNGSPGPDNVTGSLTADMNSNPTTYDACPRCENTLRLWKNVEHEWRAVHNQQLAVQEQLERQVADLKTQLQDVRAMLAERVSPRQPRGAGGVGLLPDTEILARWTGLGWAIRQCVHANVREPAQILTGALDHLRHLTPYYKHFLSDRQSACQLAQAAIWQLLAKDVFAGEREFSWMLWAGKNSKHLVKLADATQQYTSTTAREFHTWRSHTSTFIASGTSASELEGHAEQLADTVEGKLKQVLKGWKSAGLRTAVVKIIREAIQLDGDLCQQRAWWFAQYPVRGPGQDDDSTAGAATFAFDPATMKVPNDLEPEAAVVLVVSPALVKAGDARGEYYDSSVVIAKSEVCGLPSAASGRRTSTPGSQAGGDKRVAWR